MYETIKNKVVSAFTRKRVICGVLSVFLIGFACSLIGGYLDTRADYQRTREQLERTQRALDASRKLNQQLKASIAASQQLNSDAGRRIEQAQDYQRETGAGIERLETNQRETGARIGESLEHLDAARGEIERGLELIGRIERANQTQQENRATP
nr:MAG TPA: cell division protein [Caudoviricetes sp.]